MIKKFNEVAGGLSTLDRYSQTRLINPESVLEHTGYVCLFCATFGGKLLDAGEDIDIGMLMQKAAYHDIEEYIVGDIPTPTKYDNFDITYSLGEHSKRAARKIDSMLEMDNKIFNIWHASKNGKEGLLVKIADKISVVYKADQEIRLFGNKSLTSHIRENMTNTLFELIDMTEQVFDNSDILVNELRRSVGICRGLTR